MSTVKSDAYFSSRHENSDTITKWFNFNYRKQRDAHFILFVFTGRKTHWQHQTFQLKWMNMLTYLSLIPKDQYMYKDNVSRICKRVVDVNVNKDLKGAGWKTKLPAEAESFKVCFCVFAGRGKRVSWGFGCISFHFRNWTVGWSGLGWRSLLSHSLKKEKG